MSTTLSQPLFSLGHQLDTSPSAFGWYQPSSLANEAPSVLRQRLEEDGFLYLPGALDSAEVDAARERILVQLHALGMLQPGTDISEGIAKTPWQGRSCHSLIAENLPLQKLLFSGRMLDLFALLLDHPVRHLDFTWIRVIGRGKGTAPHADSVYMNRGTTRLYTAWTPLMEIPLEVGGLMMLPGSHRIDRLRKYYDADVDTYCENIPNRAPSDVHQWVGPMRDGKLSENPPLLSQKLGLPWLTSPLYRPGDVLIFSIYTLHASLDNQTPRIRLSTDTRYQRSDEPADPRWIGAHPSGHSNANRRSMIC